MRNLSHFADCNCTCREEPDAVSAAVKQLQSLEGAKVRGQPYCQACCKAFPTAWLLIAHLKYSLVHQVKPCCIATCSTLAAVIWVPVTTAP